MSQRARRNRVAAAASGTTVQSPCISVCRMDEEGKYCVGCWRTIVEIADWIAYSDDERRAVIVKLRARRIEAQMRGAFPADHSTS